MNTAQEIFFIDNKYETPDILEDYFRKMKQVNKLSTNIFTKNYNLRYFVLNLNTLTFFYAPERFHKEKERTYIDLVDILEIKDVPDQEQQSLAFGQKWSFAFTIYTPMKYMTIYAKEQNEYVRWCKAFMRVRRRKYECSILRLNCAFNITFKEVFEENRQRWREIDKQRAQQAVLQGREQRSTRAVTTDSFGKNAQKITQNYQLEQIQQNQNQFQIQENQININSNKKHEQIVQDGEQTIKNLNKENQKIKKNLTQNDQTQSEIYQSEQNNLNQNSQQQLNQDQQLNQKPLSFIDMVQNRRQKYEQDPTVGKQVDIENLSEDENNNLRNNQIIQANQNLNNNEIEQNQDQDTQNPQIAQSKKKSIKIVIKREKRTNSQFVSNIQSQDDGSQQILQLENQSIKQYVQKEQIKEIQMSHQKLNQMIENNETKLTENKGGRQIIIKGRQRSTQSYYDKDQVKPKQKILDIWGNVQDDLDQKSSNQETQQIQNNSNFLEERQLQQSRFIPKQESLNNQYSNKNLQNSQLQNKEYIQTQKHDRQIQQYDKFQKIQRQDSHKERMQISVNEQKLCEFSDNEDSVCQTPNNINQNQLKNKDFNKIMGQLNNDQYLIKQKLNNKINEQNQNKVLEDSEVMKNSQLKQQSVTRNSIQNLILNQQQKPKCNPTIIKRLIKPKIINSARIVQTEISLNAENQDFIIKNNKPQIRDNDDEDDEDDFITTFKNQQRQKQQQAQIEQKKHLDSLIKQNQDQKEEESDWDAEM